MTRWVSIIGHLHTGIEIRSLEHNIDERTFGVGLGVLGLGAGLFGPNHGLLGNTVLGFGSCPGGYLNVGFEGV